MRSTPELIVDEATPGHYFWTVLDLTQAGEPPLVLDFARGPLPSQQAALTAGQAALSRLTRAAI